ncbi:MAG: cell division protein FtsH, partial [Chloroflexi bacterium]|nr:cell division protein FtsH [Chloroflexota bacterium]
MGNRWLKNSFVYLLVIIALVAIAFAFLPGLNNTEEKPISDVFVQARAGKVEKIVVEGDRVNYTTTDSGTFHARKEPGSSIME